MGRTTFSGLAAGALLATLGACGGSDAGSGSVAPGATPAPAPTPTPSPTPTPTPTPAQFAPVTAQLFDGAIYNPDLRTIGHGTLAGPNFANETLPFKAFETADDLKITYDGAAGVYRAEAGIAGEGILYQVLAENSDGIPAAVAMTAAEAQGTSPEIYLRPAGASRPLRYISLALPWANAPAAGGKTMFYFGTFGVAQPTRAGDMPSAGTARFDGMLQGWFVDDSGGTGLDGAVRFDVNFGAFTGSGAFVAKFYCMMGCTYPDVGFEMKVTQKTSPISFEGDISLAGGAKVGRFSGLYAGPGAQEVLLELTFTYIDPTRAGPVTFAGIVAAKRAD